MNGDLPLVIFCSLVQDSRSTVSTDRRKNVFFNGKLMISRKRLEIRPQLLLITNKKWHTPFQMRWKSSTLDDFEGHWQPV